MFPTQTSEGTAAGYESCIQNPLGRFCPQTRLPRGRWGTRKLPWARWGCEGGCSWSVSEFCGSSCHSLQAAPWCEEEEEGLLRPDCGRRVTKNRSDEDCGRWLRGWSTCLVDINTRIRIPGTHAFKTSNFIAEEENSWGWMAG